MEAMTLDRRTEDRIRKDVGTALLRAAPTRTHLGRVLGVDRSRASRYCSGEDNHMARTGVDLARMALDPDTDAYMVIAELTAIARRPRRADVGSKDRIRELVAEETDAQCRFDPIEIGMLEPGALDDADVVRSAHEAVAKQAARSIEMMYELADRLRDIERRAARGNGKRTNGRA